MTATKKPRYTQDDLRRYATGYTRSDKTDIRRTFARVRAEQKAAAERQQAADAEAQAKVRKMRSGR